MKPLADTAPDPQWEAFAAREPFFAVLTAPRFLRENLTPEHEREFFASGESLVSWMLGVIDAALAPQFAPLSTLDYGCGVGRLALPLAARPGSVTAVDRSPAMLDLARRHAEQHNLRHIAFQTPAELLASPRKFDLVVCYQVLQRLRRSDAMDLVATLTDMIGPSGVGVFQFPLPGRESTLVAASRWTRERVPAANAIANRMRGKGADEPFIPTHTFELADILHVFDRARFRSTHVALEPQDDLTYATVFAQRAERTRRATAMPTPQSAPSAPAVSDADIDRFNAAAESYFASLKGWEHHLAKPFANIDETPTILASLASLLHAIQLAPGMRVLEFGAGSGWLSHFLSQMGCEAVVLDVAPTALAIARELYRRQPPIGARPEPEFLLFNGRRIELEDASVDRVICFDAFHHAPNPDEVIREFSRILKPGGIAAFAEPGPRHSEAPKSTFESHTYGVVELDVDVHQVWRTAQAAGFADLRLCVFHGPPFLVSLNEYEDLLAGGASGQAWSASTRKFLRYVRNFVLVKGGGGPLDSRTAAGLACAIRVSDQEIVAIERQPVAVEATVTNTGSGVWLAPGVDPGGVALGAHLGGTNGMMLDFDFHTWPLTDPPRVVRPGETVRCQITIPGLPVGTYRVEFDCVAAHVAWFAQAGSQPVVVNLEVRSA